ncbi:MAG: DegV family EDD domain-containing protein [Lachnospiraceae bacterium]|nr:DegV family EDD domain-containing protein [Lachnospiraceae bacterium]
MNPFKRVASAVKNLYNKAFGLIKDPARSFRERVFILLTIVTDFVIVLALIGDIIYKESIVEIIAIAATIVMVPIITFVSVKFNKAQVGVTIIVVSLVFVILPALFYFGGGVEGGGVLWIIFAYLYTGLVLSNRWKPVLLVVLTIEAVGFYLDAYFHPERVVQHSRDMFYVDSLLSIIIVGIVCCLMVWFEEWLFREENRRAREEAQKVEELNRSQNRFFSNMSHEIRTPINTILGLNEIILRQEDASDEIIKDAGNIQGAGKMLLSLINDILDFSKIEAGSMDIVPVEYSVGNMISEIVNMIWLKAQEKGLAFNVDIDPQVPTMLYGDEVRIKQVLINLLNNAVKYTNKGSVSLHMEAEMKNEDQILINISVSDTGMGIKQEALPYLFDAFRRVDQEKNRYIEGTGLGLSIVKMLVELMGGEITVNSVYMQGSTFTVSLHQKIMDPTEIGEMNITNDSVSIKRNKYESSFVAPECRILIVDDNEMNLQVEKKLLHDTALMIDTVTSGMEAVGKTLTTRYDMILMDHIMPEMDGIECLNQIRTQTGGLNANVPVVVLTANAGSENQELYNNSGFDGYLVKPVSGLQLERMLLTLLPAERVIRTGADAEAAEEMNTARFYRRKLPVLIAAGSVCDLPDYLTESLKIPLIPFQIYTEQGVFSDGVEIVSEELIRYMEKESTMVRSEAPAVDSYAEFFSDLLRRAHHVIYLTTTASMSREYEMAGKAAESFENVTVIDTECLSSSLGLIVLSACRMAQSNLPVDRIIAEIGELKKRVHCSFFLSNTTYMTRRGYISQFANSIMKTLWLRPSIRTKNNTGRLDRLFMGSRIQCMEKYIRHAFPIHVRPDTEVLFITYCDMSEEELEMIRQKVLKHHKFDHIILQKASAAISSNCGPGTFGLLYLDKMEKSYNLGTFFTKALEITEIPEDFEEEEAEDAAAAPDEAGMTVQENREQPTGAEAESAAAEGEQKWYEQIPGVDAALALKNSGSEETAEFVFKVFYESIDERADEIESYYQAEDWSNYTIKVHALKSSAKLIGAMDFAEKTYQLEMAGKEGNIDFIREQHEWVMSEYLRFKKLLGKHFADDFAAEEGIPEADASIMESFYDMIKDAAKALDYNALESAFNELREYTIPKADREKFFTLKDHFERFDYEGILKTLEESDG